MGFISKIGTAVPDHTIKQNDVSSFMARAHGLVNGAEVKLNALYRATGIQSRYSVIKDYKGGERSFFPSNDELEPFPDTKARMDLYRKEAIQLAVKAVTNALGTEFNYAKITDLITVSCTGFYAPGLDIDLINRFNLDRSLSRTAINYMGCYAAISAIRVGDAIIAANPNAKVLIVAVELCSIHFQKKNTQDNRIANALFGDGSAALLMEGKPNKPCLEVVSFKSDVLTEGEKEMAWNVGNLGFEMKLSTYIPKLIESGIDHLLSSYRDQKFSHFAIHPGGKKILDVVEKKLGITKEDNFHARNTLRSFGNMSSPTILFVLQSIQRELTEKNNGENIFGLAFGPGLTLESMALKVIQ